MIFTPLIAAAILAFTPIPTRAVPLTPATLNLTDLAAQIPGPIPLSVLPDNIVIPDVIKVPTEATSPKDKQHLTRPGFPAVGMGHGPVVHTGFQTITVIPTPIIDSLHKETEDGHRAGQSLIAFHETPKGHQIGPRGLENSTTFANETSVQRAKEISKYVTCMNEPVDFTTLISHMDEVEAAIHHHFENYTPSSNETGVIFKGLRFKMELELGTRLLTLQEAEMRRQRLCRAKNEQPKHETMFPRSVNSAHPYHANRAWKAIEAQAIEVAEYISHMDPKTITAFNFHRFIQELARMHHRHTHGNQSAIHNGTTLKFTDLTRVNATTAKGKIPGFLYYKADNITTRSIPEGQTKDELLRTIEQALNGIDNFAKFEPSNLAPAGVSQINKMPNLDTRSVLKLHHNHANSTEAAILKQMHIDSRCRKNPFAYLTRECRRWRQGQNRKFYEDALKNAFPNLQSLDEKLAHAISSQKGH